MLILFIFLLLCGIIILLATRKSDTFKVILKIISLLLALIGAYGIFTFFL